MTRNEAAIALGVSVRTLTSYVQKGDISVRYVKGRTSNAADFDEAEVKALKEKLAPKPIDVEVRSEQNKGSEKREVSNSLTLPTSPMPTSGAMLSIQAEHLQDLARALVDSIREPDAAKIKDEVPVSERVFLTVEQSASFLGVSVGTIEKAVKSGKIPVHRELARGRRIKRADLTAWAETL